jgi:hypothetical protein
MSTYSFTFRTPNYGRSISDDGWEIIEAGHIQLWKSALKFLSKLQVSIEDRSFTININWAPTLKCHERHFAAMKYLLGRQHASVEDAYRKAAFPRHPAKNEISVTMTDGKNPKADVNIARHAVESLLYDIFLMMNLAAPGSCDFYRASLLSDSSEIEISISNVNFEAALLATSDSGWPKIKMPELQRVVSWYRKVRQGTSQIPSSPLERALFALLHISIGDTSPTTIIWLFYAFESLLQTSSGENFSAIVRRLSLLLEANGEEEKRIKKGMRKLYDLRSSIVHGGFEVIHPAHNEILDKRTDESFERIIVPANFGLSLLLGVFQRVIEQNLTSITFKESLLTQEAKD